MVYRVACHHSSANITLVRQIPPHGEVNYVNYFITRAVQHFIPITVDIYRSGGFLAAFRCENGSFADRFSAIGEVIFTGRCQDPTVIINTNATVSIKLDLQMKISDMDQTCSSILIGPQSKYIHSHS